MSRIISYILLAQMIYFVGASSVVIFNWKINQDIITEKYCVNKDKPMMNCDGKCYLSKQLENLELREEQERKNHPNPKQKVETLNYSWIIDDLSSDYFTFHEIEVLEHVNYLKTVVSNPCLQDIFHPPTV
jgi:hypothetical protein